MHVLIVYAHPELESFTAGFRDRAVEVCDNAGWTYDVSVPHANGGADGYVEEVDREQRRVAKADLVLFFFPMWWGGPPAVVKGRFDRVMSYGFSYVDGVGFDRSYFRGRNGMVCVSTGGTPQRYTDGGTYGEMWRVLWPLQHCGIKYMGYNLLEPFVAYGSARSDDDQRRAYLDDWTVRLTEAMQATQESADPLPVERGSVDVRPLAYTEVTDDFSPAARELKPLTAW